MLRPVLVRLDLRTSARVLFFGAGPAIFGLIVACGTEAPPRIVYVCPENHFCDLPPTAVEEPPPLDEPAPTPAPSPEPIPPYPAGTSVRLLQYGVVDAAQVRSTGALVVVSDTRELVVIDPLRRTEARSPLPSLPVALSVSNDGRLAAVGYAANVSLVDLATRETIATCPAASRIRDLAVDDAGIIHILSGRTPSDIDVLSRVDTDTCATSVVQSPVGQSGSLVLTGSGRTLYYQASDLYRCTFPAVFAPATPAYCASLERNGTRFEECSGLWFDDTGRTLLTGCGQRFHPPAEATPDVFTAPDGRIAEVESIVSLAVSAASDRILVLGHSRLGAPALRERELATLHVYGARTLQRVNRLGVPPFPASEGSAFGRGRFVFADSTMQYAFVVMESADGRVARSKFALATLPLYDGVLVDAGAPSTDAEVPDAADAN